MVSGSSPESASAPSHESCIGPDIMAPTCHQRLPIDACCKYLEVFRERLYPTWPVVNVDDLISKLIFDVNDLESYALAASICAATVAKLRLSEHAEPCEATIRSYQFARGAHIVREQYNYQERQTVPSILIPFFLHIYFANTSKIQTAAVYLRESITWVHWLGLNRDETYKILDQKDRSLRLQIFWMILISERWEFFSITCCIVLIFSRTFCEQNWFPAVLVPIEEILPYKEPATACVQLR